MRDYHRILEISTDSTEEEIRAQYKRLVRIYHPDRFTNPQDKAYVEQKLKEITEAYHALLADVRGLPSSSSSPLPDAASTQGSTLAPKPVVVPTLLDFGQIPKGVQRSLQFQLLNDGGIVNNLQLHYGGEPSWFNVTSGRRLHKSRPFPMVFAIIVDASRLQAGKSYHGGIRIEMDEATTHLSLSANVVKRSPFMFLSPRIALALSMILLLVALAALQLFGSFLPTLSQNTQSFQPLEVALSKPTATTGRNSTEGSEAAIVIIQPAAITPSPTPTLMERDLSPSNSPVNLSSRAIQSEVTTVSPTGIRGRTGVKILTPNALLLPPVELWAQTVSPTPDQMLADSTPPRSATATARIISTINDSGKGPVSEDGVTVTSTFATMPIATPMASVATNTTSTTPASTATSLVTVVKRSIPTASIATSVAATTAFSSTSTSETTPFPVASVATTAVSTTAPSQTATSASTPTSTYTSTATVTSTLTRPTSTLTPTSTRTPTNTRTPASTATPTNTRTPTNTATRISTHTPTSRRTPLNIPTFTPTSTLVVLLTDTITPLPTSVATSIVKPVIATAVAGNAIVLIPDNYNVNARADISVNADVLQILLSGTQWVAVGRTIDSTWLLIRLHNEQYAWVYTTTVLTAPEQVNLLPVVLPE